MAIRVMLVDDHQIMRDGLRSLLAKELDIKVVGEADSGRTALEQIGNIDPDVLVMDVGMPGLNGIDATRKLLDVAPSVRVIALSMHYDRRYVADMLGAGACGYVMKDSAFEELATAIRSAHEGRTFLSGGVATVVVEDYIRRLHGQSSPTGVRCGPLSSREREVLQLIAEGHSTKQVAALLQLSVKTVETHRRQVMDKLRIYNVAGLIKYAVREGLTSLD